MTASGAFSKKTALQEICSISQPPRTGPSAEVIAVYADHVPMARPRSSARNEAPMIARLPGTRSAPPTPCAARATINCSMSGARPHQTEASANRATPALKIRLRPCLSPSAPPTSSSAASSRAYDSTTHCTSATDASMSACSAGSATLTTVPSMNTMLEPRIVTARTYGCDDFAHGDAAVRHRTTPLSQGCMTMFAMADPHQFPGQIMRVASG